jgi:hypothetical protein
MSFVDTYPAALAECRTIRHQWELAGWAEPDADFWPAPAKGATRVVVRVTSCLRCEARRTEWFAKHGAFPFEKVSNRYSYPTGYIFKKAEHPEEARPTGQDFNNVAIKKAFP